MHANQLPITGPCPIDLDAIGFDRSGRVSHCTHCSRNVHILSNMTKGEARRFFQQNKGKKLCISYAKDSDGSIRFRPEPTPAPTLVPVARLRRRPSRAAGLAAALGVSAALAACTPHAEPESRPDAVVEVETPEVVEHTKVTPPTVEPVRTVVTPPEPMPLAGAAVIPEDVMMEGEIEVPDPDAMGKDEPCDRSAKETKVAGTMQRL